MSEETICTNYKILEQKGLLGPKKFFNKLQDSRPKKIIALTRCYGPQTIPDFRTKREGAGQIVTMQGK